MLKTRIVEFLNQNKILNKGFPLSNYLSYILAGIYLLPLDLKIIKTGRPFLRVQDDYLIFCKNKKEPERILKELIEPELNKLDLNIQTRKLYSGKFHQEPLEFLGFRYHGGFLTVSKEKTEEFKKRIILITHLTRNKPKEAVIKQLNNKLLGFGHYYKFGKAKETFEALDSFIRQRLRRCLLRNKDAKNKSGNMVLTNEYLKQSGLKSLEAIYIKYTSKKRLIPKKNNKKGIQTGIYSSELTSLLFKELKEINQRLGKIESNIKERNTEVVNRNT